MWEVCEAGEGGGGGDEGWLIEGGVRVSGIFKEALFQFVFDVMGGYVKDEAGLTFIFDL